MIIGTRYAVLQIKDLSDFKKLDKSLVYEMDKMLTTDIPKLLQQVRFLSFVRNIFSS